MKLQCMSRLSSALLAMSLSVLVSTSVAADDATAIRARLDQWTKDFNAGRKDAACDLFSKDLLSDVRGQGEADYTRRCDLITKAIDDREKKFHYDVKIKEILSANDVVIVRLDWTLRVLPANPTTVESGMDIFRKEKDGVWRIIRFMAYED